MLLSWVFFFLSRCDGSYAGVGFWMTVPCLRSRCVLGFRMTVVLLQSLVVDERVVAYLAGGVLS